MSSDVSRAIEALSDPGRREVLEHLGEGPWTAAQLANRLAAPQPLLEEWLEILLGAGLVAQEPDAQLPTYQLDTKGVEELRDYLERVANLPSAEIRGVPVERGPETEARASGRFLVRRQVTLHRTRERAFQRFTAEMGDWWPLGRWHFGTASPVTVTLEPQPGGRWYERGEDGSETDWGEVLVFEPSRRLVLSWRLLPSDPALELVHSELDVTFTPVPPQECRVRLEHRGVDPIGAETAAQLQDTFEAEQGWTELLKRFAERR
ncbi:MAG: ArsR/SmtB family transcription factor [Candidatus Dormibacteria bacterium]